MDTSAGPQAVSVYGRLTKMRILISVHFVNQGKEFETRLKEKKPGDLSDDLRTALGMPIGPNNHLVPPPWLIAMQRYGPPPSYPNLKIPGLNAPIPEVRKGSILGISFVAFVSLVTLSFGLLVITIVVANDRIYRRHQTIRLTQIIDKTNSSVVTTHVSRCNLYDPQRMREKSLLWGFVHKLATSIALDALTAICNQSKKCETCE